MPSASPGPRSGTRTRARAQLSEEVGRRTGEPLHPEALWIGFARRATLYKRPHLVFTDLGELRRIAREVGPLELVFAGKAHPRDEPGKELIRRVFECAQELRGEVRVVYLENHDLALAKLLSAGVDLWLNTPRPPQEASGTSGMKAAHNGVPSLSVLDGWWIEGHIEGVTGWSIGRPSRGLESAPASDEEDARELYVKLAMVSGAAVRGQRVSVRQPLDQPAHHTCSAAPSQQPGRAPRAPEWQAQLMRHQASSRTASELVSSSSRRRSRSSSSRPPSLSATSTHAKVLPLESRSGTRSCVPGGACEPARWLRTRCKRP
jgi:hypothetical protein